MMAGEGKKEVITALKIDDIIVRFSNGKNRVVIFPENDSETIAADVYLGGNSNGSQPGNTSPPPACSLSRLELDALKLQIMPPGMLQWKPVNSAFGIEQATFPAPANLIANACQKSKQAAR